MGKRIDIDAYHHHDVYQVLSYCIANNLPRGILVYPAGESGFEDEIEIRNSNITIEHCTIDLGLPLGQFRRECDQFTQRMLVTGSKPLAAA
jgi:hypothetical protein